ncbi:MAG TPA: 2-oxoacid:acceptor oxidoreductase family protein [Candidatus Binatia bacterium]|nr:2-oxoacid:acceptor oxidoreductase family protein [Candidatus Binatia bacterium]
MPSAPTGMELLHGRSPSFYDHFERKDDDQHQTHYCPGCGHGILSKLVAETIDTLGIQDRAVLISPVGCSVFGYYYFDVGNIQAAHGRSPAIATAVKRSRPDSIVIGYQGDGDLAAIGTAEIIHAANRGENITVIFVNNAIYGMTGGQMAPTTLVGAKSTTTPLGRDPAQHGYPLKVCELLATLEAPVFIERVALGSNKQIMATRKVLRRALENQIRGLGFSLVEVLSPCPTIWGMDPVDAEKFVSETMTKTFPLGNFRDRTKEAVARDTSCAVPDLEELPGILGLHAGHGNGVPHVIGTPKAGADHRITVAGFGGQGVLVLGEVLAEAGLSAGYHVSWLPSYGPQMRSGTSNCHVRICTEPVDSPVISRPSILIAFNEPSLRKFLPAVEPGGLVLYNAESIPPDCLAPQLQIMAIPGTAVADRLGSAKAGNFVMLGALLEATGLLPDEALQHAMRRLIRRERLLQLDDQAMGAGRAEARRVAAPSNGHEPAAHRTGAPAVHRMKRHPGHEGPVERPGESRIG